MAVFSARYLSYIRGISDSSTCPEARAPALCSAQSEIQGSNNNSSSNENSAKVRGGASRGLKAGLLSSSLIKERKFNVTESRDE